MAVLELQAMKLALLGATLLLFTAGAVDGLQYPPGVPWRARSPPPKSSKSPSPKSTKSPSPKSTKSPSPKSTKSPSPKSSPKASPIIPKPASPPTKRSPPPRKRSPPPRKASPPPRKATPPVKPPTKPPAKPPTKPPASFPPASPSPPPPSSPSPPPPAPPLAELLAGANKTGLPPRPYTPDQFEPYTDATTMDIHYSRHHQAAVTNLRTALATYPQLNDLSLEQLVRQVGTATVPVNATTAVRNNAGSHWNHSLYWRTVTPPNTTEASYATSASPDLKTAIDASFGSYEGFKAAFNTSAATLFGSGWTWAGVDPATGGLAVVNTPNQDNPLMAALVPKVVTPIVGLDVWEHNYYLKYQNRRADFIAAWWNIINWTQVSANYALAKTIR